MSHVWKSPPGRPSLCRHGLSSLRWMSPYRTLIVITFLTSGRMATVSTTDLRPVGEWSTRGPSYIFATYFTTYVYLQHLHCEAFQMLPQLPIRRSSHSRPSKTMEMICQGIETLALAFPGVSFTVSTIRQPSEVGPRTSRVLHIPKVPKSLSHDLFLIKELLDIVHPVCLSSH